ncbi:TetR/AcrR family transcriptional regulator [Streptomyces sp. NPDC052109]|uniref:TetR/AcrR family transcriptional regulator n=1 Tax=Streptomyces sp. NPDC052109 TaxID=3155527 RepID=UPI0034293C14
METAKRAPRGTKKRDTPLTEAGIYAAALRLIDTGGVETLTMRKLAAALDANPMSLYHHVPNKEALLRGVAAMVGAQFRTVTQEDRPWQERIRQLAEDFRALAHRHPKLMTYSFGQPDFVQPEDPFWLALADVLTSAGVPQQDVSRVAAVICAAVFGVLIAEINGALRRWSTLPPATGATGEGEPADATSGDDRMFYMALNAIIMSVHMNELKPYMVWQS